jgi:hypothetical protein
MGAVRAQKVGVHEQPVEKDFDATRGHEYCENNLSAGYRQWEILYLLARSVRTGLRTIGRSGTSRELIPYQDILLFPHRKVIRRRHTWTRRATVGSFRLHKP